MKEVKHIDFRDQIARNKFKSFLLSLIVFATLIAIGYVIGLAVSADFFGFMTLWIIFSIGYIWVSYYFSSNIALLSVGAKEADQKAYRNLYNIVEGLAIGSGLPMPKIYIMNENQINAFASGRDYKHAVICVTTGSLEKLNKEELEGVLAHELSHIKNYDIRFATLVAVMVGMISIISQIFLRSLWYGSRDRDNGKGNAVFLLIGIVLAIVAPILVKLVQLAISRRREFMADAGSVEITRYPKGLISALKKISNDKPMKVNGAVAPLFFSDPMKKFFNLMSTHPPIEQRVKALEAM
ncbi:MAG: M48 family metallopeptidase [archaeon]